MKAKLFLVATPIGNLQDISLRAIEVLKQIDFIACEDTRQAKKILNKFSISSQTISFHQRSNPEKIIKLLHQNKNIALISDSGTPLISDPGSDLIQSVLQNNFTVSPLPGSSAFLSALICSGFSLHHFEFLGFIPHKKGRQKFLQNIALLPHTSVFYESTHRILKFCQQAKEFFPQKEICLAREMTKLHEEFIRGKADKILDFLIQNPYKQKGEFTVVVSKIIHPKPLHPFS